MTWWQRYWFRPAPLVDLAVLRITAVGLQLLLLYENLSRLESHAALPEAWYAPLPILRLMTFPFGSYLPSLQVLEMIWFITAIAGVLALVGFLTNLSLLVFAAGNVFIQAFLYSFGDFHHPEAVMMITLTVLALSPSGGVLSLDQLLRSRGGGSDSSVGVASLGTESVFARWPILLVQWIFVLMYLSAVLSKLVFFGPNWLNGFTLQGYLIRDGIRWDSPLALWVAQHHLVVLGLQYMTIWFQATFALAVIFPKLRWVYVPVGIAFHVGILLTLRADFYQWIALYVVFIPWSQVLQAARRYLAASGLLTTKGATGLP